ncbi:MAG: SLBB domain-containing protein [Armatimonadota bacterium]|nr:SLBB domain-containing protein [Armatimonadota bacterium]
MRPFCQLVLLAGLMAGLVRMAAFSAPAPPAAPPSEPSQPAAQPEPASPPATPVTPPATAPTARVPAAPRATSAQPTAPAPAPAPAAPAEPVEPQLPFPVPPGGPGEPSPEAGAEPLTPFGYSFFASAPTDFTVAPDVPIPASYVLDKGDKLRIRYWAPTIPETTTEATVAEDGSVTVPGIGDVQASGLTREQFRQRLGARLREQLKNPSYSAELIDTRTINVFVAGAARRPGRYSVKAESNLFNVIYAAGGAADEGSLRRVILRRANRVVAEMDVYRFFMEGDLGPDVVLQDQDVVFFPITGPRVGVAGQVARPALYEILEGTRISDALRMAGGLRSSAYPRILRLRRFENGRRVERTVDAQALLADPNHPDNVLLRDGDALTVEMVTPQVRERVNIRGNVSFPGDYSLQRYPTARALIEEAHPRIGTYWERADLTRALPDGTPVVIPIPLQQLLDGKVEDIPLQDLDEIVIYEADEKKIVPLATVEGVVKNPATFRVPEGMRVSDLLFAAGGLLQDASLQVAHIYRRIAPNQFKIIRLSPGEALKGNEADNLLVQDGDRLVIYRQREVEYRPERITVVGELQRPGEFRVFEGMTLYDLLLLAGNVTDQAAGTVEIATPVLDEKSNKHAEVRTLPLEEVLNGKYRDEPVKPGMLISVPRRDERLTQPAKVELRGRFRRPGTYALLHEGETLQSLIERAGGLTEDADPFGVSLTRTRERMLSNATAEQIRTVMETMDQLLPPVTSAGPGGAAQSGTSAALLDAETSSGIPFMGGGARTEKVLLVSPRRLTAMSSSNRISFDLEDRETYLARVGKVALCDGDVVEVPRLSDVVQVLGAVQSPGPVFHQPGMPVRYYIDRAGGGAPDSDLKRSVVIKVTGGVRKLSDVKVLDPGDVVVVASKHQIVQPPYRRRVQDTIFELMGVALVLRGLR